MWYRNPYNQFQAPFSQHKKRFSQLWIESISRSLSWSCQKRNDSLRFLKVGACLHFHATGEQQAACTERMQWNKQQWATKLLEPKGGYHIRERRVNIPGENKFFPKNLFCGKQTPEMSASIVTHTRRLMSPVDELTCAMVVMSVGDESMTVGKQFTVFTAFSKLQHSAVWKSTLLTASWDQRDFFLFFKAFV